MKRLFKMLGKLLVLRFCSVFFLYSFLFFSVSSLANSQNYTSSEMLREHIPIDVHQVNESSNHCEHQLAKFVASGSKIRSKNPQINNFRCCFFQQSDQVNKHLQQSRYDRYKQEYLSFFTRF